MTEATKQVAARKLSDLNRTAKIGKSLNEQVMDRVIRHQVYLQQLATSEVVKINALLDDLQNDLVAQLERRFDRIARQGFDAGPVTSRRLQELYAAVRRLNLKGMKQGRKDLTKTFSKLSEDEATFVRDMIENSAPVKLDTQMPSPELLRKIATSSPINGTPLTKWFQKLGSDTQTRLEQAIRLGLAEGQTLGQVVQRIRGTRANRFTDGVLSTTRREAEAIARTGLNHVSSAARMASYEANADIIKGLKWVSTLDTRTCLECGSLDGKTFKLGTQHRQPPAHVNCRCTLTPVLKSYKEMGLPLKGAPPASRASMNGLVPSNVTFEDWLQGQPKDVQKRVLGRGRMELYRKGKFRMTQFTNDSGRTLTLKQLRQLEGIEPTPKKPKAVDKADAGLKALEAAEKAEEERQQFIRDQSKPIADRIAKYDEAEKIRQTVAALSDTNPSASGVRYAKRVWMDASQDYMQNKSKMTPSQRIAAKKRVEELKMKVMQRATASVTDPDDIRQKVVQAIGREDEFTNLQRESLVYSSSAQPFKKNVDANIAKGQKFVGDLVQKNEDSNRRMPFYIRVNDERSNYDPRDRWIHLNYTRGAEVVVHELGHTLEHYRSSGDVWKEATHLDLKSDARRYLEYRVKKSGQTGAAPKLNDVLKTNVYKDVEVGWDDDFDKMWRDTTHGKSSAYYTGKDYSKWWGGTVTEVVSMGLQLLYEDAPHFAETDPEYFKLIVGYLKGVFK